MPKIIFDESFIEESVFRYVADSEKRGNPDPVRDFYTERDALYNTPCGNARENAFRLFYQKWFSVFGLEDIFYKVLSGFPLLNDPKIFLRIKPVFSRKDESSELFKSETCLNIVLTLQCERVTQPEYLKSFLRHELMHASDMIDEKFCYDAAIRIHSVNDTEENLIRERFRILWAMYVDARIQLRGFAPLWSMEKYAKDIHGAFRSWPKEEINRMLHQLESGREFKQMDLIRWSTDARLTKNLGEGGLVCPVCGLSSYSNSDTQLADLPDVIKTIQKECSGWRPEMGICPQCFDLYASRIKVGIHA